MTSGRRKAASCVVGALVLVASLVQPAAQGREAGLPSIPDSDAATTSFADEPRDEPHGYPCVGDPPRQTDDPMSPPCMPFFDGDNGGATYPGVTGDEITVVAYFDYGAYASGEVSPDGYVDIDAPPKPACPSTYPSGNPFADECDHVLVRALRALSRHVNSRFQTYDRHVHLWAFFTSAATPPTRSADAEAIWEDRRPFAVLDFANFHGNNGAFVDSLSDRGVMVFDGETVLSNAHTGGAPYSWSFDPAAEVWADQYASYVCQKVVPYPVTHSDGLLGGLMGQPRKYGLYYTRDTARPDLRRFAQLAKDNLADCGIVDPVEATFEHSGFMVDNRDQGTDQLEAVLRFKTSGVTTVLWLGGLEGKFSRTAALAGYHPEIVFAGDGDIDGSESGRHQNQTVWRNAWGVQFQIREDGLEQTAGARAAREADPAIDDDALAMARERYPDVFLLASGIQLAGPDLTPSSVEAGFRSIPPHTSDSPYRPACNFPEGDFTCVDDAMEVWWDPAGLAPGGTEPGCLRMVRDGRRFLPGEWEGGDDVFADPSDPCTSYPGRVGIHP